MSAPSSTAEEIADILALKLESTLVREVQLEVGHAIRSVIEELPNARTIPALQLQHAAQETLARPRDLINASIKKLLLK